MKKYSTILFLILTFLFFAPSPALAASSADVQTLINTAIAPLQAAITDLQNRVFVLETNVTNLLSRVTTLESNFTADFSPPTSWISSFNSTNRAIGLTTSQPAGTGCFWNGVRINGQQIQVRGVAHLSTGDIFGTGSCDSISFFNIANFPANGSSFLVDLDLFWQGKLKHQQFTLTVPQPTPTPTPTP